MGGKLDQGEANLVPRVVRGHWERGWREAALWEGEESFWVASSFYYKYISFVISA